MFRRQIRSDRRLDLAIFLILGAVAASVVIAGCHSSRGLASMMTRSSQARLNAIPDTGRVVLSLRMTRAPGALPSLGETGRELYRTAHGVLVETAHSETGRLASIPGITAVAVWGDETAASKLGPRFRNQLLDAWASGSPDELPVIASFDPKPGVDLHAELQAAGAHPRTVAGSVVTLDASPEAIFRILEIPGLVRLQKPRPVPPLGTTGPR